MSTDDQDAEWLREAAAAFGDDSDLLPGARTGGGRDTADDDAEDDDGGCLKCGCQLFDAIASPRWAGNYVRVETACHHCGKVRVENLTQAEAKKRGIRTPAAGRLKR